MRAEYPLKQTNKHPIPLSSQQNTSHTQNHAPKIKNIRFSRHLAICFFGTPSNTKHNKNTGTYTLIFHPQEEIKSYH